MKSPSRTLPRRRESVCSISVCPNARSSSWWAGTGSASCRTAARCWRPAIRCWCSPTRPHRSSFAPCSRSGILMRKPRRPTGREASSPPDLDGERPGEKSAPVLRAQSLVPTAARCSSNQRDRFCVVCPTAGSSHPGRDILSVSSDSRCLKNPLISDVIARSTRILREVSPWCKHFQCASVLI